MYSPSGVAQVKRNAQILELRKSGLTYGKIAAELGCKPHVCRRVVSQAMRRLLDVDRERLDEILQLELVRTDDMLAAIWSDVLKGDHRAIMVALKIQEQRAKYLGLYAVDRFEVPVGGMTIEMGEPKSAADDIRQRLAEIRERLDKGGSSEPKRLNGHAGSNGSAG